MSAFLGVVQNYRWAASRNWRQAIDRMVSRCGDGTTVAHVNENLSIAFHGSQSGLAENAALTVMLDGFIDNMSAEDGSNQTRALLESCEAYGVAGLRCLTGCYSLAVIDWRAQTAYLQRDRFGTCPLYYAQLGNGWCWASEIKCLTPLLAEVALDRDSLPELFHYRWLAGPRSLLQGVNQLLPGHAVVLQAGRAAEPRCYWKYAFEPSTDIDFDELVDRTEAHLSAYLKALAKKFPRVGIPLSAGVDSSLLAALAGRAGFSDLITISARYPNWENPELAPARATARHLNLEHQTVDVEPAFVAASARPLLFRLEEPARHYNIFPLSRMLEALAPRVDLILYGEAADTVFGPASVRTLGRFMNCRKILRPILGPLRDFAARFREGGKIARSGYFRYLAELLALSPDEYIYRMYSIKSRTGPESLVRGLSSEVTPNPDSLETYFPPELPLPERMQMLFLYTEVKCHLETMNRLSAPMGVQVAVPFLSARLLDMAVSIPTSLKYRNGFSKPILRQLGARYFPRERMYQPKYGFDTPTEAWLNGPLHPFLEILREPRTLDRGIFRREVIDKLDRQGDWELLWTAACLETLLRFFVDGEDVGSD